MDQRQIERVYGNYAGVYDKVFGRIFQQSRETAVRRLRLDSDERILEVGVGTGLSLPLYPSHCEVVGIDFCASMLGEARQRVERLGLNRSELFQMDAGSMTFADDSFDTVVAMYVMTVVPDPRKVLAEMIRVCRPGGRILILNHFRNGNRIIGTLERALSPLCQHIGFRTDLTLEQVLDGAPVAVTSQQRVNPLRMWYLVECVNKKSATLN
ncbi:MAG: SAM-dependent methyltransferase [Proteobacteria bacterium]|nr:MAG: SAM-dependent methyltransferase [Pseudomonadota bacterium]